MTEETEVPSELDDMNHDDAIALLRSRQNFALAVPAGIVAAIVGAVLWAAVVYVSGYSIGLMAIVVGALAGYAVRIVGKGVDQKFGILGAVCAAFGWALGTMLADVAMLAQVQNQSFMTVLAQLDINSMSSLLMLAADVMDLLFLGIAVFEGYKFAFLHRI